MILGAAALPFGMVAVARNTMPDDPSYRLLIFNLDRESGAFIHETRYDGGTLRPSLSPAAGGAKEPPRFEQLVWRPDTTVAEEPAPLPAAATVASSPTGQEWVSQPERRTPGRIPARVEVRLDAPALNRETEVPIVIPASLRSPMAGQSAVISFPRWEIPVANLSVVPAAIQILHRGLLSTAGDRIVDAVRAWNGSSTEPRSSPEDLQDLALKGIQRITRPVEPEREFVLTSSSSNIPGTEGLLSGRPIYTVYIPMESAKDWILQYCPAADAGWAARSGNVFQFAGRSPLEILYAFVMYRPAIRFRPGVRYAFVHGWVNASGRFEQLAEVGPPALEDAANVLDALRRWEFRASRRDGEAVSVEVLLSIPNVK